LSKTRVKRLNMRRTKDLRPLLEMKLIKSQAELSTSIY
jgi:hypothetical protein